MRQREGLKRETADVLALQSVELGDDVLDQHRDVLPALAQVR